MAGSRQISTASSGPNAGQLREEIEAAMHESVVSFVYRDNNCQDEIENSTSLSATDIPLSAGVVVVDVKLR